MKVKVVIQVSTQPLQKDIDSVRSAAARLTNNQKSITAHTEQTDDHFSLITEFTMRTAAQYKVVDEIDRVFKFWTFDISGYQDISISFS